MVHLFRDVVIFPERREYKDEVRNRLFDSPSGSGDVSGLYSGMSGVAYLEGDFFADVR
jgi:hypothetical protein